jgi:hypothetical protein
MSSLDIAPHPESAPTSGRDRCRTRHRLRVSFRRAGICTIWRLGFRQFSFHRIARVPRRTVPDTWTRPPVSCHALFPLTFRRQVRHRTQGHPSNPSRLRRGYNEAPRGAPLYCRDEVRRDNHRVSGRQGPAMRTRLPTMPHDTASRTLARLRIGPDADHGAWSSRRGHPHT